MTPREVSSGYGSEIIARRWIGCWIDFVVIVGVLLAADGILGNDLYQKTLIIWVGIALLYIPVLEVNPLLAGGIPAGLVANFSKTHQRLGDMAADTYVILRRDTSRLVPSSTAPSWVPGRPV
jgi:uncharacterized RDD family membrane protein YckC